MKRMLPVATMAALTFLAPAAAQAAFPGANGRIAFNWTFGCDGSVIATMQPDGSDLRRLTVDPCQVDGPPRAAYPDYTADGSNLLFFLDSRLARMTAAGLGQTTTGLQTTDTARPSVSPAGDRVAYTRVKNGRTYVYTAKLDGTDEKRLRRGSSPRYSPNGRLIAYAASTGGRITIIRAGSGKIVRRLNAFASTLDWAPGGKRLVYSTFEDLFVVRADGSRKPRRLTRTERVEIAPVWSPDGKRIAFVRLLRSGEEDVRYGVFTMRAGGGKARRIYRTSEERSEETLEPLTISWQPVVGP